MAKSIEFAAPTFADRMKTMLKVDFRRAMKSRVFYILVACALLMPVLMTVMMSMMDGSVSVDPTTGVETVLRGPENAAILAVKVSDEFA